MFPEPRIVGGSNAAFGRWPWQISLRQWRTSTYLHKCGAALLNENWAITAAHCVDNVPPSDLLLRLGEYDLAEEEEPYGYQERRVQIVASHPQFDPRTFEYDLALLRFYEPVTFQPNIIPVCVPDSDEDFIGQTAFVTGWGRLYEDGPLPSVLQEVAVPVINNTICESMYRSAGYIEHIPHIFICAGWKKGGYDSCEGDSGGPMVLQRESDKRFQLGGVISWGIGCAEANQPGVYTRISEFRDWINQILQFFRQTDASIDHDDDDAATLRNEGRKLFGGYRITPKQCRATKTLPSSDPRSSGPTICMFNHECAQRNGEVVGACMDGFLFGACCQVPKTQQPESTLINDAQNAYYQQYQQNKLQQQETETNKIVSQAYENFAENSVQAQSQENAYGSGNVSNNDDQQLLLDTLEQTSSTTNADTSTENSEASSSTEADYSGQSSTENVSDSSREPPMSTALNNPSKMSSSASPQAPQNDDFVMQALNTLPPEDDDSNQQISFTTEIPTKIVNRLTEHQSSESESFEESHASPATDLPNTEDNVSEYESTQTHNKDNLYNAGTFSHSDITHPGADAVLVENDLQFSTGYGPQPVVVPAPEASEKTPISNSAYDTTTATSSSITTHVDSIETIIQQLNNSSHGPTYNIINPQSSTFAYEIINATNAPALDYTQEQTTLYVPVSEAEPEHNEKQTATPLYGSSSSTSEDSTTKTTTTTNGHYADELVLEEDHTMPETNYNDQISSNHHTSDFNKMPAMGIAYPVDMSHMEEDNLDNEKIATSSSYSTQQPAQIITKKPHPVATYIGVVTSQNYGQQQPQVPHEVIVSSHTTKVEGNIDSSVEYKPITMSTNKLTTPIYQPSTTTTTLKPVKTRPNLVTKRPANKKPTTKSPINRLGTGTTSSYLTTPVETKAPEPSYQQPSSQNYAPSSDNYYQDSLPSMTTQKPTRKPIDTKTQTNQNYNSPSNNNNNNYYQESIYTAESTTKPIATRKPTKKHTSKPVSTSYVTGPTSPRPSPSLDFGYDGQHQVIATDDKLDSFVHSTAESLASAAAVNTQESPLYDNSVVDTPVPILRPQPQYNTHKKPAFVQKPITQRPPSPTVLITPKPSKLNTGAGNHYPTIQHTTPTTPLADHSSTSYLHNHQVTRQPGAVNSGGAEYVGLTTVNSNDFDDPGYYGTPDQAQPPQPLPGVFTQSSTESVYPPPSDDKPAFPGYYGPTPTYPAFAVPGEKVGSAAEEETYTSPNDFVNFPPVRNPNLNMSAASSAVTSDLELSTPAFVEDTILKNKMNTLVHKIVESLQGNFEALADIIDESNNTAPVLTYQASPTASSTVTKKPATRKPVKATTVKTKVTTKKPATTKAPVKKTATTRKPEVTTKKPEVRRTTTTTRKPATRKPTRKVTTTTKAPQDEIVDEEDEEDVNPSDNEIPEEDDAQSGPGVGGRKIQCGVRPHIKSGRIVGGKGATFGAYPWQVLVRESTWLGLFTKNKCGGVLITNRYVITAAHCQPGFLASLVAVMGEFDISGDLESKRAVTKNVKRVIVHRQYDPATFENDIALLELESPVQFDTHIVPICMPPDNADFTGRMATVTGWGRLKYGGGVPSVLQEVQVPVIENSVCQEMFNTGGHNKKILNSFLCAGYATGLKDSCEGDSGGPLVLQRPDGRYELAGTVSHGIKCAAPYLPGVYMRTTFYKPWLRSITGVK
ncbi:serine protease filzig [Musca vetustissima]|uniref:serine protease filzig n=1 Tax=Musca vetustissima TaxID=27455 RepID=UPI002AB6199C|nr:serine protease filzig [Musca vetustissima]